MTELDKKKEEAKRERMLDPDRRWKYLQETIAWVQANLPEELRRNTPRACRANEAKHLKYARRTDN